VPIDQLIALYRAACSRLLSMNAKQLQLL
jgi:hypothetical protein